MKIKVTQKHIDKGYSGCANECPIALALKEATSLNVTIYESIFLWRESNDESKEYLYDAPTPQHVLDKIRNYDDTRLMTPFEFEIDYER